jgi:hypothetical protein
MLLSKLDGHTGWGVAVLFGEITLNVDKGKTETRGLLSTSDFRSELLRNTYKYKEHNYLSINLQRISSMDYEAFISDLRETVTPVETNVTAFSV